MRQKQMKPELCGSRALKHILHFLSPNRSPAPGAKESKHQCKGGYDQAACQMTIGSCMNNLQSATCKRRKRLTHRPGVQVDSIPDLSDEN